MKLIKLLFALLCLIPAMQGQAQTIDKYFVDMPAILMPGLESKMRLELTEYYKSERRDSIRNSYGYQVKLLTLDTLNNYISVQAASNTRFEMITMLRPDSSVLITVIHTVCGPICSSYIHFYDKGWNEIRMEFPEFTNRQWLKSTDETINGVKLQDIFKGVFLEYKFNPHEKSVEVRNNSVEMLGIAEQEQIKSFFMEDEVMSVTWKEGEWRLETTRK